MKSKSCDHYANQRGPQQVMGKPSPSTVNKTGVTGPIQKPAKSTVGTIGVTPSKPGMQSPNKGSKRK